MSRPERALFVFTAMVVLLIMYSLVFGMLRGYSG